MVLVPIPTKHDTLRQSSWFVERDPMQKNSPAMKFLPREVLDNGRGTLIRRLSSCVRPDAVAFYSHMPWLSIVLDLVLGPTVSYVAMLERDTKMHGRATCVYRAWEDIVDLESKCILWQSMKCKYWILNERHIKTSTYQGLYFCFFRRSDRGALQSNQWEPHVISPSLLSRSQTTTGTFLHALPDSMHALWLQAIKHLASHWVRSSKDPQTCVKVGYVWLAMHTNCILKVYHSDDEFIVFIIEHQTGALFLIFCTFFKPQMGQHTGWECFC